MEERNVTLSERVDVELEVDDDNKEEREDKDIEPGSYIEDRQLVFAADLKEEDVDSEGERVQQEVGDHNIVLLTLETSIGLHKQTPYATPQEQVVVFREAQKLQELATTMEFRHASLRTDPSCTVPQKRLGLGGGPEENKFIVEAEIVVEAAAGNGY